MIKANRAGRHRAATRPITPLSNLTQTSEFGRIAIRRAAGVTATGVMLTAGIATAAEAAPTIEPETKPNRVGPQAQLKDTAFGTIVSLDQSWDPGDELAVTAAAPVVEAEPEEEYTDEAASRGEVREETWEAPAMSVDSSSVVGAAYSLLGIPYVYGGESMGGLDCSGLVKLAYGAVGVYLPHSSGGIAASGYTIPASEARPGDVVAYPGHVAIYIGNGMMIEATVPGALSTINPVRGGGWFVRI